MVNEALIQEFEGVLEENQRKEREFLERARDPLESENRRDYLKSAEKYNIAADHAQRVLANLRAGSDLSSNAERKSVLMATRAGISKEKINRLLAPEKVREKEREIKELKSKGYSEEAIKEFSPKEREAEIRRLRERELVREVRDTVSNEKFSGKVSGDQFVGVRTVSSEEQRLRDEARRRNEKGRFVAQREQENFSRDTPFSSEPVSRDIVRESPEGGFVSGVLGRTKEIAKPFIVSNLKGAGKIGVRTTVAPVLGVVAPNNPKVKDFLQREKEEVPNRLIQDKDVQKFLFNVGTGGLATVKVARPIIAGVGFASGIVDSKVGVTGLIGASSAEGVGRASVDLGLGVSALAGSALLVKGDVGKSVRGFRARRDSRRLSERLEGQLVTREDVETGLVPTSKDVSVEIKGRPLIGEKVRTTSSDRDGVLVREGTRTPVFGEEGTFTSQDLVSPDTKFVALAKTRRVSSVGSKSQSKPGLTKKDSGFELAPEREVADIVTARQIQRANRPAVEDSLTDVPLLQRRVEKGDSLVGRQQFEARDTDIQFFEFEESFGPLTTTEKGGAQTSSKKLISTPRQVEGRAPPLSLEEVNRFDARNAQKIFETPDVVVFKSGKSELRVDKTSGRFALLEYTAFRRFPRGFAGIPGRPSITKGQLTPEGLAGLKPKKAPLIKVSKVEVKPKPPENKNNIITVENEGAQTVQQVLVTPKLVQPKQEQVQEQKSVASSKFGQSSAQETFSETLREQTSKVNQKRKSLLQEEKVVSKFDSALAQKKKSQSSFAVVLPKNDQANLFGKRTDQKPITIPEQDTKSLLDLKPAQLTRPAFKTDLKRITEKVPARPSPPFRPRDLFQQKKETFVSRRKLFGPKKKRDTNTFSVQVKDKGTFRTVGFGDSGVRSGARFIDTKASASLRILPGSDREGAKKAEELLLGSGRYRRSKVNPNVLVEKNKFRISSGGEKAEIRPKRGLFGRLKV